MGSSVGTLVGAGIGSVVPGVGTALGATLGGAGGALLSGSSNASNVGGAYSDAAAQQAAYAQQAANMAQFTPVGITTRFGSSQFGYDPYGKLTSAGYTVSPELKAIQDRTLAQAGTYDPTQLAQFAQPLYGGAASMFGLGGQLLPSSTSRTSTPEAQALAQQYYAAQQGLMPTSYQTSATPEAQAYAQQLQQTGAGYLAQSPEEARAEYMRTQQAALAPGQEQQLSSLRNQVYQTGRGGLATGGTEAGGLQATNPELAAYYNSLANTNRQLAAGAEQAAQQRQTLGLGMLGQGLTAQQQSEATQRQNMLQNLGLSLGFGTQGLGTGTTSEQLARANYAQDIGLSSGLFGTGASMLGQVPALTTAGYGPLQTQLGLASTIEQLGQTPLDISAQLAGRSATAGAKAGEQLLYGGLQASKTGLAGDIAQQGIQATQQSALTSALSPLMTSAGGSLGSWFNNLIGGGSSYGATGMSPAALKEIGLG